MPNSRRSSRQGAQQNDNHHRRPRGLNIEDRDDLETLLLDGLSPAERQLTVESIRRRDAARLRRLRAPEETDNRRESRTRNPRPAVNATEGHTLDSWPGTGQAGFRAPGEPVESEERRTVTRSRAAPVQAAEVSANGQGHSVGAHGLPSAWV
jgi:hypothetical protein